MDIKLHLWDNADDKVIVLGKVLHKGDQIELEDGSIHEVVNLRYHYSVEDEDVVSATIYTQRVRRPTHPVKAVRIDMATPCPSCGAVGLAHEGAVCPSCGFDARD